MTIDPTMTLGSVAARIPGATRLLDRHGIDACCGGGRSIAAACALAGADTDAVVEELLAAEQAAPEPLRDWSLAPVQALVDHIVLVHHHFTRTELSRVTSLVARVAREGGLVASQVDELTNLIGALCADLLPHMEKEERALFPTILALETDDAAGPGALPGLRLGRPMAVMERDHRMVTELLSELRQATHAYAVPAGAPRSLASLYGALEALDHDLRQHINLEENVLFPRARAAEEGLLAKRRSPPSGEKLERAMTDVLHAHESFQAMLDDAADAAQHLAGNPTSYTAGAHCTTAWKFVFAYALPHLEHEDTKEFPALERAGAPPEAIYLLGEDHRVLRELAARLAVAGLRPGADALSEEASGLLVRFLRMFDWHIAREEQMLRDVVTELSAR